LSSPNWAQPLPRPVIIPEVMELGTLADLRALIEKHLPAEYREVHLATARRDAAARGRGCAQFGVGNGVGSKMSRALSRLLPA
jgi:hypothetical protein